MKLLAIMATAALLAGCVGPAKSLNIRQVSSPTDLVVDVGAIPAGSVAIGEATGVSCKNKMWDPPATEHAALLQLKTQAIEIGAKGVAAVTYRKEGTTFTANCWEAIYATGTMYR